MKSRFNLRYSKGLFIFSIVRASRNVNICWKTIFYEENTKIFEIHFSTQNMKIFPKIERSRDL